MASLSSGAALLAIAAELDALGAPLPQGGKHPTWNASTIRNILSNPFYAGYVRWGLTKTTLDPRTGKTHRAKNAPRRSPAGQPGG